LIVSILFWISGSDFVDCTCWERDPHFLPSHPQHHLTSCLYPIYLMCLWDVLSHEWCLSVFIFVLFDLLMDLYHSIFCKYYFFFYCILSAIFLLKFWIFFFHWLIIHNSFFVLFHFTHLLTQFRKHCCWLICNLFYVCIVEVFAYLFFLFFLLLTIQLFKVWIFPPSNFLLTKYCLFCFVAFDLIVYLGYIYTVVD
jgi:hypothetical protein